jgi:hypothetical protein
MLTRRLERGANGWHLARWTWSKKRKMTRRKLRAFGNERRIAKKHVWSRHGRFDGRPAGIVTSQSIHLIDLMMQMVASWMVRVEYSRTNAVPGTLRKNVSLVQKSRRTSKARSFSAECPWLLLIVNPLGENAVAKPNSQCSQHMAT